jgi:hypothetical protein
LDKLLCANPHQRISAKEALQHPFFDDSRDVYERELKQWYESQGLFERPIPNSPLERLYMFETPRVLPVRDPFEPVSRNLLNSILRSWYSESRWKNTSEMDDPLAGLPFLSNCNPERKSIWSHTDVRIKRMQMVRYVARIIREFDMSPRTFYLALNFVDRYLNICYMFPIQKLPLLAATCLHVASKCEDVSYMGVKQLVHHSPGAFVETEMLQLEEQVVKELDFALAVPTTLDFVVVLLNLLFKQRHQQDEVPINVEETAFYLCYICAYQANFICTRYSELASAIVWMSCALFAENGSPDMGRLPNIPHIIASEFQNGILMNEGIIHYSQQTLLIHMNTIQHCTQLPHTRHIITHRQHGDLEKFGQFLRDPMSLKLEEWR